MVLKYKCVTDRDGYVACECPSFITKTSNSSLKTRGAAAPRTRITWRLC